MPIKVESYQSADGKFHASEIEAVRHEVLSALWQAIPELKDRKLLVENNIDRISEILQPLAALQPKNHPEPEPGTTLEPEDRGGCDCSASMAGNGGEHHPTCPMFRGQVHCRYAHPPGSRCPACTDVPRHVTVIPQPEARARA